MPRLLTSIQLDFLRNIDLERVLIRCGASPHPLDKCKWHTSCGVISVNRQQFMNWSTGKGGGGAIDLVCFLRSDDFKAAVIWLASNFDPSSMPPFSPAIFSPPSIKSFKLPHKDRNKTDQIIQYLTVQRRIPRQSVITLIQSGKLYADAKGNSVFLLLGKEKKIVGAELRGTGSIQWRGMAPGSRKHLGCFYVLGKSNKKMIFCESAIDAISCQVLWPEYTAISTSGANYNPAWLKKFIAHGCKIYCGFDSDRIGNILADKMIKLYPSIKRLRPSRHDWNEVLQNHKYPSNFQTKLS